MRVLMKKLSAFVSMAMMLVLMVAMNVSAAVEIITIDCPERCVTYTKSIIDTTLKTSLNITKYNFSGQGIESDGQHVEDEEIPEGAVPLAGVTFKYYKVADLTHINENEPAASLKYNLTDTQVATALDLESPGLYTSDVLIERLTIANADDNMRNMLEQVVDRKGTAMDPTDEDGKTIAEGLEQGLYLVIESVVPGIVYERAQPFFVSLPMTNAGPVVNGNTTYEPGTLWQYDVFVYPKNKVDTPEIEKNIVKGEEREKYDSIGVGDTVTYEIKTEVPLGVDKMSKFDIMDTMSAGLTFDQIQSVRVGDILIPVDQLVVDTNVEGKTFAIHFITDSNNALTGRGGQAVTVTYTATLNENCIVTPEGNPNHATLVYNHNASISGEGQDMVVEDIADPRVYTYGIDLEKTDNNGNPLAGVEYELYGEDRNTQIYTTQRLSTNEAYQDVNSYYPNGTNQGVKIVTDANGRAYIWGLAPGTYYLKETKTLEGYTLQKDLIKVTIGEKVTYVETSAQNDTKTERAGTYGRIPDENVPTYYRLRSNGQYVEFSDLSSYAGKYVNFGTNAVYTKNGDTYEKVQMYYPTVKADVDTAKPFGAEDMNVLLKVVNNADFDLPLTGGIGTYLFTIGGAIIIFAAGALLLIRRKRSLSR